ncbi:hypothetical protein M0802_002607 [Mischocyttarus mexicanus]|nr:hypothetical protein M0802_002607 [Mischocyttarus mexicanus]
MGGKGGGSSLKCSYGYGYAVLDTRDKDTSKLPTSSKLSPPEHHHPPTQQGNQQATSHSYWCGVSCNSRGWANA